MPRADWFYEAGGREVGPVTADELRQLVGRGQITPATLVWRAGLPDWQAAREVDGLFANPPGEPDKRTPGPSLQRGRDLQRSHDDSALGEIELHDEFESEPGGDFGDEPDGDFSLEPVDDFSDEPGGYGPHDWPLASIGSRTVAALIDTVVVLVPMGLLALVAAAAVAFSLGRIQPGPEHSLLLVFGLVGLNLLTVLVGIGYHAYFEAAPRIGTVGKRMQGLRVTDENGQPLSAMHSLGRGASRLVITMAVPYLLGFFLAALTEKKQTVHDLICKTLVLQGPRSSETTSSPQPANGTQPAAARVRESA